VTLPIAPVKLPADLAGQANGQIDQTLLTDVGPSGRLHHTAARAWRAMVAAAFEAGFQFTYTYGGTYRTLTQQTLLFESRYSPTGTGGGCKTYKGQQWCKKSSNLATAAVPGTSNHGLGLALDIAMGTSPALASSVTPKAVDWLIANAATYGFSAELQSEAWHWRYVTGDTIPQAVLDFEGGTAPPPTIPPTDGDTMLYIAKPTYAGADANTPWLAVFESGQIRRALNADVKYAQANGVAIIDQDSREQHEYAIAKFGI
jgi:hypothetical protein